MIPHIIICGSQNITLYNEANKKKFPFMNHLQKQLSWGNLPFARENTNWVSIPVTVLGSTVTGCLWL